MTATQVDGARRGSAAPGEKKRAGAAAGSTAGSVETGESGDDAASTARQSGEGKGRGRGRAAQAHTRRGSLLGLEQASSKDDEGEHLGAWKVPFSETWLDSTLTLLSFG